MVKRIDFAPDASGSLVATGILREVTDRKRNRVFISDEIIRAVEGTDAS